MIPFQTRYEKNQTKKKDNQENEINLVLKKNNIIEISIYYYVIDQYQQKITILK